MPEKKAERLGDANRIAWWLAWHPLLVIVVGLVVFGLPIWILAVLYTNSKYSAVLEDYQQLMEQRREARKEDLGSDTKLFTLTDSNPSYLFLKPGESYFTSHLIVGDRSVIGVEGLHLDMTTRIPYVRDQEQEIFYDQISSVSYEKGKLIIRTSDGGTLEYQSSQRPEDALRTLRDWVRDYKE
jgi:hypothetical protein